MAVLGPLLDLGISSELEGWFKCVASGCFVCYFHFTPAGVQVYFVFGVCVGVCVGVCDLFSLRRCLRWLKGVAEYWEWSIFPVVKWLIFLGWV